MSFGFGPAAEMHKKAKSLKRQRPNTLKKIKELGTNNPNENSSLKNKKASPEQLEEIRKRLQKENKRNFILKASFFLILLVLSIYFLGFYKN
ncbi:hypothetical protein SAMN04489761_4552 [Tenacibaculum sp. MAR_2009_124]|uniref:hypothetical protein n=1 Tax=Tenacibaculum sp. MAR_2009_124 TaxID=1250059 RepID=UPI00089A6B32|nr:hypothetical protein [Tenacibaculum sp. MAR_2009_124]SED18644.1 hypothetical protein SAMN04489761_4552 [Tenacibaculum sp. MAR_2009_124]